MARAWGKKRKKVRKNERRKERKKEKRKKERKKERKQERKKERKKGIFYFDDKSQSRTFGSFDHIAWRGGGVKVKLENQCARGNVCYTQEYTQHYAREVETSRRRYTLEVEHGRGWRVFKTFFDEGWDVSTVAVDWSILTLPSIALWARTTKNTDRATRSSVCSFACTAHLFACSALLARSLRSLPRSWESELFLSQNDLNLPHSGVVANGRFGKAWWNSQLITWQSMRHDSCPTSFAFSYYFLA